MEIVIWKHMLDFRKCLHNSHLIGFLSPHLNHLMWRLVITSSNIESFRFVYSNSYMRNLKIINCITTWYASPKTLRLHLLNNFIQGFCHISVLFLAYEFN